VVVAALRCGKEAAALNKLLEASADDGSTLCALEHMLATVRSEAHVTGQVSLADGSWNASAVAQTMIMVGFGPLLRRQGILYIRYPPYDGPALFKGGVCAAALHYDEYQSPMCARFLHCLCLCRAFFVTTESLQRGYP
jgi:hypothetical protein